MMLQALAADWIAHRKQKVVMIVVMGVEELLRFDHQVLVELQLFRRDLQVSRLVGKDIQEYLVVRTA